MATQRYSVTPHPIETLLTWVKSGEIAIPEIQRPFVWEAGGLAEYGDLAQSLTRLRRTKWCTRCWANRDLSWWAVKLPGDRLSDRAGGDPQSHGEAADHAQGQRAAPCHRLGETRARLPMKGSRSFRVSPRLSMQCSMAAIGSGGGIG